MHRRTPLLFGVVFFILAFPALALADADPSSRTQVLSGQQFWAVIIGGISPLVGYVVNYWAPWVSEHAKAIAQVGLSAGAGAIYVAVSTGDFAFDAPHLQVVGAAVLGALLSHQLLWKNAGVNTALGAGSNRQG